MTSTVHRAAPTQRPSSPHAERQSSRRAHRNRRRGQGKSGQGNSGNRRVNGTAASVATAATTTAATRPTATSKSTVRFTDLGLSAVVLDTLAAAGIETPTPIQAMALPDALAGRDVLGRAQTGSGKTLAFGIPLLTRLAADRDAAGTPRPRGLVLLPTRELAHQVEAALRPLADVLSLRLLTVVGGESINKQIAALRRGVDVVIATPGRLEDLMQRRAADLRSVRVAVLDEADHMADLGFLPAVTRILDAVPARRQVLLFSATLDHQVDRIVKRYLTAPVVHTVGDAVATAPDIDHRVLRLSHADKVAVAAELGNRDERTLFFVRTKRGADRLAKQLRTRGVDATSLHGNLNQNQRNRALAAFTQGTTKVLVATDVAARGIHVDDLDLVVHYDPPADHKAYEHRSGRTARAGASGTVVTLVQPEQSADVARIHAAARVTPRQTTVRPGHPAVRDLAAAQH